MCPEGKIEGAELIGKIGYPPIDIKFIINDFCCVYFINSLFKNTFSSTRDITQ